MTKRKFLVSHRKLSFSYNSQQNKWPTALKQSKPGNTRLMFFLFFLFSGGWIYLLFFSSWFAVQATEITGSNSEVNEKIKKTLTVELNAKRKLILPNRNIFLFKITDANKIQADLGLEKITYYKNFLDKAIYISYRERKPVAVLAKNGQQYYLDKDGQTISAIDIDKIDVTLPIIFWQGEDYQAELINSGLIKAISTIYRRAADLSLKIISFKIGDSPDIPFKTKEAAATDNKTDQKKKGDPKADPVALETAADLKLKKIKELTALTNLGWSVYFGDTVFKATNELDKQLFNLETFIKEKLKDINPRHLKYLDLRFGEKIFYK